MVKVAVVCHFICDKWYCWLPAVGCFWEDMNMDMLIDGQWVINLSLLLLCEAQ